MNVIEDGPNMIIEIWDNNGTYEIDNTKIDIFISSRAEETTRYEFK